MSIAIIITPYKLWHCVARTPHPGDTTTHADTDHVVEVEQIQSMPAEDFGTAVVFFNRTAEGDQSLVTYKVENALRWLDPPEGFALYDERGMVSYSTSYRDVVGNVTGYQEVVNAIDAFRKMSDVSAGRDLITTSITNSPLVGFMVGEQRPFVYWLAELCDGLGYHLTLDEVGGGVIIYEHYDPADFTQLATIPQGLLIENRVRRVKTDPQQYRYIVHYRLNYSDPSRDKTIMSDIGYQAGNREPKHINSIVYNEADAKSLAGQIVRDSMENSMVEVPLVGVGLGYGRGEAYKIAHELIKADKPCVIYDVTEDANIPETMLLVKVLEGEGLHV